jgi:membrane-bound metal-dependent hydrolase YbcI (DUF457 family)
MPTPLGHALGAVTVGWLAAKRRQGRAVWRQALLLGLIGAAPDLDLLFGRHSMETHSIGAALLAGALAAWRGWPVAATRLGIFTATALAWLSHPALDALGADTSEPLGVMFFWPFSNEHVMAAPIFDPVSRRYWLPGFLERTAMAVLRELLILVPLASLAWWLSSPQPSDRLRHE